MLGDGGSPSPLPGACPSTRRAPSLAMSFRLLVPVILAASMGGTGWRMHHVVLEESTRCNPTGFASAESALIRNEKCELCTERMTGCLAGTADSSRGEGGRGLEYD